MFNFQELMLSGYILCYGPLALIIFGFIAFALLTDKGARRTYLRRLDPRPEAERVDEGPIPVTRSMRVITPAGASVLLEPDVAPPAPPPTRTAPVELVEAAKTVEVEETAVTTEATPDDLKLIEGIGPKISSVLADAGIVTFDQLSHSTPEALREILNNAGMSAIHDTSTWPEQAALAAIGEWDALALLQNELRGGRRD